MKSCKYYSLFSKLVQSLGAEPVYICDGLKILFVPSCSLQCANQPATLDMAKIGVNKSRGIPVFYKQDQNKSPR